MKKVHQILAATVALMVLGVVHSEAQTAVMTVSNSAPTLGVDDIADLSSNGQNPNNNATAIWSDKPGQGQSFTTLDNAGGYLLNSVTLGYNGNGGGGGGSAVTWTINIGTYTNGTFTLLDSVTATGVFTGGGSDFATWTLNLPLLLSADTTYAFEAGSNNAGLILQTAADDFAGGTAISTNPPGGATVTDVTAQTFDRQFAVGLTANATPEPTTWALLFGGLTMLGFCVRRKASLLD